jgi:hypothetical protein
MLTQLRGPVEQVSHSPGTRSVGAGAAARLAAVGLFCQRALAVLAAATALVAIMALKIATYLPRLMHH